MEGTRRPQFLRRGRPRLEEDPKGWKQARGPLSRIRGAVLFPALILVGVSLPGGSPEGGSDASLRALPEHPASPRTDTLVVAQFSLLPSRTPVEEFLAPAWLPLSFGNDRGLTEYRAARRGGRDCLHARTRGGASGLVKPLVVDPAVHPTIRWSWWVQGPVPGGDLTRKEGDDFAARIYVNFRFEPSKAGFLDRLKHRLAGSRFGGEAPGRSLVYVWGNTQPPGTAAPNAYTDKAMVIVVRSGETEAGAWHTEERDIREDFRMAFGDEPPEITSIAIMSDADDTGAAAEACYGDISLLGPF